MVRCIHAACGHALPRRVNFCPYCRTAQGEAGPAPAHPVAAPGRPVAGTAQAYRVVLDRPVRAEAAAAASHASAPAAASEVRPATPDAAPAARAETAAPAGGWAAPTPAQPPDAPPPLPSAAGPRLPPAAPGSPPPSPRGAPPAGALPPKREPVRLRWWLLALAALWAIWLIAKPSNRRIEAQMDKAIALATDCKPREAQSELIALRGTKATPEQLQRVQKALNEASASCTRKRQRDKAWREAKTGVESALSASTVDRARQRLRAFTKRWGEDDATRAMKEEIDAREPEHRRADEVEGGR
jgi:hypothetical protein